ncbi:hypothetical protein K439DRAFT_1656072 [Ramaria rubella]|nr:hypothetical protein K439DRAFT_1656072 [Ramaria rubella]
MPMRHPLQDLPLDTFVAQEQRSSIKRPLSPSAALLSPSKRRILSAEGLYSSERRKHSTPSRQLFSELVGSPKSPAKKLQFVSLSHPTPCKAHPSSPRDASPRPETPVSRTGGTAKLAPSPEIASTSAPGATSASRHEPTSDCSRPSTLPPPMRIPREMPKFADRYSFHWPGFDIHLDTHITIPTSQSIASIPDVAEPSDVDDTKENVRPRRRPGKRLGSEDCKAGKSARPNRCDKQAYSPDDINIMSIFSHSPGKRPMTPHEKQQERQQMKLLMVQEQDDETNDMEDVDQQL